MARFKVVGPVSLPILEIRQSVTADVVKRNSGAAVQLAMNTMRPVAQDHYDNVVKQVSLKLRGIGIPAGVTSSASRTISYGNPDGSVSTFKTRTWPALSEKYRKRKPTNYKFWKKTGILSHAFDTFAKGPFKLSLTEQKSTRNHHKNRVNTTINLIAEPLPFPFENGVTKPFIRASDFGPMTDLSQDIDRDGLGRARFAEQSGKGKARPFIRKLSAALGKRMRTDLSKKLRKL